MTYDIDDSDNSTTKKKNGGRREGSGRPPFIPTDAERKQVETLSGYGVPHEQIAVLVRDGIHDDTLREHFHRELKAGKAKANASVGQTLFKKAVGGDTTAAIWWSKSQMRWKDTTTHEVTGKDGETLQMDIYHSVFGDLLDNLRLERQMEAKDSNKR
jgi:hypothetical protein